MTLNTLFIRIIKAVGLPLFLVFCLSTSIDQLVSAQLSQALNSRDGGQSTIWMMGLISILSGIVFPSLSWYLILGALRTKQSSWIKTPTHLLRQSIIESLRAWGNALLWSLALILPGLIRLTQFYFVNFVVMLSDRYAKGEVDALQASREIFNKVWFKASMILLLLQILSPMTIGLLFDSYSLLWKTPIPALIMVFAQMLIFIFSTILLYKLFVDHEENLS